MFWRKRGKRAIDQLKQQKQELQRQLDQIISQRTELLDFRRKVSAGVVISGGSPRAMLENLKLLTLQVENLEVQKKIVLQLRACGDEALELQKKINKLESQLQQPPTLDLISPNGGEKWQMGGAWEIKWQSIGPIGDNVDLELYQGGKLCKQIALVPDNGSYRWSIPAKPRHGDPLIPAGDNYQVKIVDPTMPDISDISDGEFEIIE